MRQRPRLGQGGPRTGAQAGAWQFLRLRPGRRKIAKTIDFAWWAHKDSNLGPAD